MAGFDPAKAAAYNKLIEQGVSPEQAITQVGITDEDSGNYQINSVGTPATNRDYGKMSAINVGQGKVAGVDYDVAPAQPAVSGSQITKTTYTETSTETVSGGGSTTITTGARRPTEASQVYAAAGDAKQAEIDAFIKDNPSNFARRKQGLPPLSPEENEARNAKLAELQDQRSQLYNQQLDAETPGAPTVTRVENTTTTTSTVSYQSSSSRRAVNFDQDQSLEQQTELQLDATGGAAKGTAARGNAVSPTSDPSQFPAYDDDGNLQPGFAINDETGQTYYAGVGPVTRDTGVNPSIDPSQFPAYDDDGNLMPGFGVNDETGQTYYIGPDRGRDSPVQANQDAYINGLDLPDDYQVAALAANDVNDPYAGLTPAQLEALGGADPTDPYIRARLGIPQLPGSTLFATGGFGTIKTGVPAIDSALGIITGGLGSLFTNFKNTIGGLFGPKVQASAQAATTGAGIAGLTVPATGPGKTNGAVNPGTDPSQFPAYDDDGNLQPGFAINEETGETYYRGLGPATTQQAVSPSLDPSQFPAYDDDGNLQPGFAINEENGQPYYRGLGPATEQQALNPAADPSQFPAYDDDGNLQPGFAINDETGETYYRGFPQPTDNAAVSLDAESGYGSEFGYAPLDNAEVAALSRDATTVRATNPNLSPEAKANLDGINEANAEIVKAQGNIQSNNLNILRAEEGIATARENQRQAEAIIAQNNAELADPNITDERRAELLANNAEQEASIAENARYIDDTTQYIEEVEANNAAQQDNIATNQVVAEENAAAFRYNEGGELVPVDPQEDLGLEEPPPDDDVAVEDPADQQLLSDEELAALEEEQAIEEAVAVEDPGDQEFLTEDEIAALEEEQAIEEAVAVEDAADQQLLSDEELAALEEEQAIEEAVEADEPLDVDPEEDPFEAQRQEAEDRLNAEEPDVFDAEDLDAAEDQGLLTPDGEAEGGVTAETGLTEPEDVDAAEDQGLLTPDGEEEGGVAAETGLTEPPDVDAAEDEGLPQEGEGETPNGDQAQAEEDQFQGSQEAAVKAAAQQQATIQARYKQNGNNDWRFRLSLSPNANYLYNAGTPRGTGAGILAPLAATDGVIFPYTPQISMTYTANYEQYDLVHSNYRGIFYKNSRVGDISLRGTFTAQDTTEANYLLAVIHFFRSVTKMFYGQDAERGTPPPICLLNGLGTYQFSNHPVVITSFNYSTPNDVDYIRAGDFNNFGLNMLNRRAAVASNPGGQNLAGLFRLANAALQKGAPGKNTPAPGSVNQQITNTTGSSYVPTKMEIDITMIPVQTRNKVSNQFSLKGFANGDLLKGGFW